MAEPRDVVKAIRMSLELSQDMFARLLSLGAKNVGVKTVQSWELGKRLPEQHNLVRLYQVSPLQHRGSVVDLMHLPDDIRRMVITPEQAQDLRLIAEAKGQPIEDILYRCVRFGVTQLDPHGDLRKGRWNPPPVSAGSPKRPVEKPPNSVDSKYRRR